MNRTIALAAILVLALAGTVHADGNLRGQRQLLNARGGSGGRKLFQFWKKTFWTKGVPDVACDVLTAGACAVCKEAQSDMKTAEDTLNSRVAALKAESKKSEAKVKALNAGTYVKPFGEWMPQPTLKQANGNNGSVSCSAYCANGYNGQVAKGSGCAFGRVASTGEQITCDTVSGKPTQCTCRIADTYTVGNNGSQSCKGYCSAGKNNEAPKGSTCIGAAATSKSDNSVTCDSVNVAGGLTCGCASPVDTGKDYKANYKFAAGTAFVRFVKAPSTFKQASGNNGSVSCSAYCANGYNGQVAKGSGCAFGRVASTGEQITCDTVSGKPTQCTCRIADTYTVGNNGSQSCKGYCSAGKNNEAPKGSTCIGAAATSKPDNSVTCDSVNAAGGLTCGCASPVQPEDPSKQPWDGLDKAQNDAVYAVNLAMDSAECTAGGWCGAWLPSNFVTNSKAAEFEIATANRVYEKYQDAKAKYAAAQSNYHKFEQGGCGKLINFFESAANDIEDGLEEIYTALKCPVVEHATKFLVGKAEGKINKKMCAEFDAEAVAACEAAGLGPEDPLADTCAAAIATGLTFACKQAVKAAGNQLADLVIEKAGC